MNRQFKTDQEAFWAGEFGNGYIDRNKGNAIIARNIVLFSKILSRTQKVKSVIEFGSSIGLNLMAIKKLFPNVELSAIEINENSVNELSKCVEGIKVYHQSILGFVPDYKRDFVLSKGLLIHINPSKLDAVYELLYKTTKRYICLAEYYNPTPVTVTYRGHNKKLFKREFTNENYTQELLKDHHNYKWLEEGLDTKLIDINYQNNKNDTFLMVCLKRNKYDAALWLLKMGADPTIKNNEYKTAIDIAIEKSKTDIVEQLIQHEKLNVNQKDEYGRSLLQNIIISGNFTMAKTLIKGGADINTLDNKGRHILYDALAYGDLTFVHHLLTYKNIELNDFDEDGNTLLQHPQAEQNDMLAKDLLVAGCDPTALNAKGESYLFNTVMRGAEAEEIVQIALKYGANVNERTLSKNTIMMELVLEASKLINKDEQKI